MTEVGVDGRHKGSKRRMLLVFGHGSLVPATGPVNESGQTV